MILVDTGPLVAACDPSDAGHAACRQVLTALNEEAVTTTPVLTEAFHLLRQSKRRMSLMDIVRRRGVTVAGLDDPDLERCFELMVQYGDAPMDFADASVVVVAERSGIDRVFTLDRRHFSAYRLKRGHRHVPFTIIGPGAEPPMVREREDAGYAADPGHLVERALHDAREALDRLSRTLGV
ncbi:MAG: PIN domain-containing protein [Gemmatimonadota bacterium]|uniref:type II toxin-antitoxin system VapC family toxin n=1 Tax=Candidatus Palauibacter scopulicola TaxID=3056741 RepID=UPI00239295A6|nr:PIN domain-containing protein [Candidatus Palauibacter scopulicola]MDE2663487.1 PIN domain-containing protein [Candidatus Palauibacter scopulicola]